MEKYNLKPCPFCGGTAFLGHSTEWNEKCSYIYCTTCSSRIAGVPVSSEYASDEKAIEVWNKRVGKDENKETNSKRN